MHKFSCLDKKASVAGLQFFDIYHLHHCLETFFSKSYKERFLSRLQLSILIEDELHHWLQQEEDFFEEDGFLPIKKYLLDEKLSQENKDKRFFSFAWDLSALFLLYGQYKQDDFWPQKYHWQKKLWQKIFDEKGYLYPLRDLLKKTFVKKQPVQIHVFNISYLPPIYIEFFQYLSQEVQIFHYAMSPCQYYWADITSDKEKSFFLKKLQDKERMTQEIFLAYLDETNPLLANWGKVGKEYSRIFDCYDMQIQDKYLPAKDDSLLHHIQNDLLLLENPKEKEQRKISLSDDSLQIHVTSSKYREIEILSQQILFFLQQDNIKPSDICVVSPFLSDYIAIIHAIFPNYNLPYKISHIPLVPNSPFLQGLLTFFALGKSRWEKKLIFQLLENPSFYCKQGFSLEEVEKIKKWVEKSNISWGIDAHHKEQILQNDQAQSIDYNSWHWGIEQWITSLIFVLQKDQKNAVNISPIEGVDFSDHDLISRFIKIFSHLKEDLSFLQNLQKLSCLQAAEYLEKIMQQYFWIDNEDSFELQAYSFCQSYSKKIRKISIDHPEVRLSFSSFALHLQRKIESFATSFNANEYEAIQFLSLQKKDIFPHKILCFIGMNENLAPSPASSSFDLLKENQIYPPNETEFLRYTFLQGLLAARQIFYVSCVNTSAANTQIPCLYLEELFSYIDRYFICEDYTSIATKIMRNHSPLSFDCKYFTGQDKRFFSFDQNAYQMANSFYQKKVRKREKGFLSCCQNAQIVNDTHNIDVSHLLAFAAHPVRYYLQNTLQIFFEKQEKKNLFPINFLDKFKLREAFLQQEVFAVDQFLHFEKKISLGPFFDAAKIVCQQEIDTLQDFLKDLQIAKKDIGSLYLKRSCDQVKEIANNVWEVPAIAINIDEKIRWIVGKIPYVTSQGLVVLLEKKTMNVFKTWPLWLIWQEITKRYLPFSSDIIWLRSGRKQVFSYDNAYILLQDYIRYFEKAKNICSPLLPEWGTSFLSKDVENVKKSDR